MTGTLRQYLGEIVCDSLFAAACCIATMNSSKQATNLMLDFIEFLSALTPLLYAQLQLHALLCKYFETAHTPVARLLLPSKLSILPVLAGREP